MKIGIGFDIHKLGKKRKLILAGIHVPFECGLYGHSDGDVILHAIADAISGALGKPDIGTYFPDADASIKGIAGSKIVDKYIGLLKKSGYEILNLDIVVTAEKPRLQPVYEKMKGSIATLLKIPRDKIGLKAKTMEGLGIIGRGKAIGCWAAVLLKKTTKKRADGLFYK